MTPYYIKLPILVLNKGQASTKYYRFLTKHGGWIWVQIDTKFIYKKDYKMEKKNSMKIFPGKLSAPPDITPPKHGMDSDPPKIADTTSLDLCKHV